MTNWKHNKMTEDELKKLVRDVYDCKTFTSLQCGDMVATVFMPIMFLGAEPFKPSFPKYVGDICKDRKNKLNHLVDLEEWEIELQQWKDDTEKRENYFKNIGMIYEDYSKAGPLSVNGYPMFMSCKIVSIEDTERFLEKYKKYEKMREEFEKEF
jgi:hypothetical protein